MTNQYPEIQTWSQIRSLPLKSGQFFNIDLVTELVEVMLLPDGTLQICASDEAFERITVKTYSEVYGS